MKTRSITIALLCMLAFAFSHVLAQSPNLTEIVIGDGTETSCQLPFNACHEEWRYTLYSEYIIPASEMGEPCVINSIAFEIDNADMMYYCELYIWLGTTEDEIHTSETDWLDPDLMTQVFYSPDISLGWEEGWATSTFELNEQFVYRGGNLVVGVGVVFWQDESILATQCTSTTHQSLWTYNRLDPWGYWGGGEKNMNNDRDEGTLSPLRPNIKLVVNTNALPVCIPEVLDLGYRPSGCWTAPLEAQLVNYAFEGSIVSAEIDNSFFSLNGLELPYDFDAIDTIPYAISCGIGSGTQTGTLTFTFDNDNTLEVPLSATAYSAQTPDVWELAREVHTFPYSETFLSGASVFDNYQLPSPFEDGNDVVFKLDFESDMLLDASVEGNNGKVVLYREGFEGLGGPCNNNTFILGDDAAYSYSCDFESGFCNDFNWINDATYPWTVTNNDAHGGMQCIKSTSLPDDTSLTSILQINLNAPEDGRISFYAKVSSHYQYGGTGSFFIDEETKIDHIRGTEWDYYSFEITQGLHVLSWVYNGGFWTNGDNCFYVDDFEYKSDENKIIGEEVPRGTYYLVASSSSDQFSVTMNKETIPCPAVADAPYPCDNMNSYNENPSSLSWSFGDYTMEYQLLFGETNPPTNVLVDWTNQLRNDCSIETEDSKTYYWQVNVRNSSGTTNGTVWMFSTYKGIQADANNIIYVTPTGAGLKNGSSWANAAVGIQDVIDAVSTVADNKPVIWVSKGTYYTNGSYQEINGQQCCFFIFGGVNLFGGFNGDEQADYNLAFRDLENNASILDAEGKCYVVGNDSGCLDGFSIQHGKEGGVFDYTNPYHESVVRNCKIKYSEGTGVYIRYGRQMIFEHNEVSYHALDGINCEGDCWIKESIISHNQRDGIRGFYPICFRCKICNNGNGYNSLFGAMVECLAVNNDGFGTSCNYILSSTIANNGIGITGRTDVICNSIVWGNLQQADVNWDTWFPSMMAYNAIEGGIGGKSGIYPCINLANASTDLGIKPDFEHPSSGIGSAFSDGVWTLKDTSPCINRGIKNINNLPRYSELSMYFNDYISVDYVGNPRVQQGRIDIGAIESPYEQQIIQYAIHPDADSIIYVKDSGVGDGSSWNAAISDLHQAMEMAVLYEPAATIWVAEGYYPVMDCSFQVKQGVKMYGGFAGDESSDYDLNQRDFVAHATVLDGDNILRVLNQSDTLSAEYAAVIDGFTLRNGAADNGAGAYLLKNMTLSHCVVEHNAASGNDAGKGGGIYADEAVIKDCFVVNNTANQGGGIYALNSSILQSLICNNEASSSGGVFAQESDILQCNIVRNQGDGLCISAEDFNSYVHLENSILWGNNGYNINYLSRFAQTNTLIRHSAVEDLQDFENGNIPLSFENEGIRGPQFINPTIEIGNTEMLGDWHLKEQSPCIDAGMNAITELTMPANDINNDTRIQNGRADMGVYESMFEAQCQQFELREVHIHSGETYDFYGISLNEEGTYEHRWTVGDCDSIIMLHLHVTDIVFVSEEGSGYMDGSSWANALDGNTVQTDGYTKLAKRLYEATPYTEFWLTDGTYYPCGDQDNTKSFRLNEGVRIYGGFVGVENTIDERNPEHGATIFTGELQADNDSANNTECVFITSSADGYWTSAVKLDGVTISDGYASIHKGAAMRISPNAVVSLSHCSVVDNNEGGIYNQGVLNVSNTDMSFNNSELFGEYYGHANHHIYYYNAGAICNMETGIVTVDSCTFLSNHSPHNGAICNDGMMRINASMFDNNTADWFGTIFSPGKIKIYNSSFSNNRADNRIGVMYAWDSLVLVNCHITENHSNYYTTTHFPEPGTSANYGGYRTSGIESTGYCYVNGCSFIHNNSNTCLGGALSILGTADISNCVFSSNRGVAPWEDPDYEPEGGGFGLHFVIVSGNPDGPALYVGGRANVTDCLFNDNYGYVGNTIGVDGHLTMNRCIISESHSLFFSQGAIKVASGGSLVIENSLLANNDASVIQQVEGVHSKLINTTIPNNSGDVIRFQSINENNNPSWVDLDNCIISGYPSLYTIDSIGISDAIYGIEGVVTTNTTLFNSELDNSIENKGRSREHYIGTRERDVVSVTSLDNLPVDSYLVDSIVTEINNGRFEGLLVSGNTRIEYLTHSDNSYENIESEHESRDGDTNLYDIAPMFVNPTTVLGIDENLSALDADWRLLPESPCINAGNATTLDLEPTALDLGGELRVKGCQIDMGAYEYGDMVWDTIVAENCEGVPFVDNGFEVPALEAGNYVFQRTGECNENTLYTLKLHVNPKTYHTICEVVTEPYELNGVTYSETGTYVQTLPNQYGCDSIITLHLVVTPIYVQTSELLKGWTWWAPTVETNIADIEASLDANLEIIQARDGTPSGDAVMGQMYKIKTINTCELSLSGTRPASVSVAILPEVNWFGYIGIEKSIGEVFNETFGPADGDKIISQDNGLSIYTETNGVGSWSGTLTTLEPGKGYVYVSQSSTPKTVVFNSEN